MLPHTVVDLMLTMQSGDYSEFYAAIAAVCPLRIRTGCYVIAESG